jgi:hypothetical protein
MTRLLDRRITQEWIYPDADLPELGTPVLVLVPEADYPVWIAALHSDGWIYTGESEPIKLEVAAWSPLPNRPMTHAEAEEYRNLPILTDAEIAKI